MTTVGITYTKERIFAEIREIFVENFEVPEDGVALGLDTRLEELDLDSIDAVDLMVEIKKRTGQKLDPEAFRQVRTVGDIVEALYGQLNK